ncbi:MAG: glycosyltransferase family 2 protein [Streptosporangiaceae bacterium]
MGLVRDYRGRDHNNGYRRAPGFSAEEIDTGSLGDHTYNIPEIRFRRRAYLLVIPFLFVVLGSLALHDERSTASLFRYPGMLVVWGISLTFVLVQVTLSWLQKPATVNPRQQAALDRLKVAVVIPCYNEAPGILDRTLYSLFTQTRLPNHVLVTDDGSTQADYTEVREWWERNRPGGVRFTWIRQENAGKKHAQAACFSAAPDADVFATIDSDSALERNAIEEALKPMADRRVVSVACLEIAHNMTRNLLTRSIGMRSLAFQLFAMSAQSVARGNVLINPGACSLYRGWLIRMVMPSYLGETFFGVPVTLGDDTMLTMFALMYGKAVHQPTAVSMPVYPEKLSHHLRQWVRWMRASTIRTFWRMRYLPMRSYSWIYVIYQQWAFFTSVAVTIIIVAAWPATERITEASLIALVAWPVAIAIRLSTVSRSDWTLFDRFFGIALLPFAALWYMLVLRQMRFYGMATCYRQNWNTRESKVEVDIALEEELV